MPYKVFARKWRPQQFSDLVGQEMVLAALRYSLDQQTPHHAYLFTGTRGVGKTTTARIVAKSLNCEKGVSAHPCGECHHCLAIQENRFMDLIETDAATRTRVEDTRELLDNIAYKPTMGRYKVYLIDEVHMLSTHSFNALLKTLEEPPEYVIFLLATTDPQKLPATVLSRCIQFHLKALSVNQISAHLVKILQAEKIDYEETALLPLSIAARGSLRDALSLLDQAVAVGQGQITHQHVAEMLGQVSEEQIWELITAIAQQESEQAILLCRRLSEQGADCTQILERLAEILHQLALCQQVKDLPIVDVADPSLYSKLAAIFSPEYLQVCYQIVLLGRRDLSLAPYPQLGLEMTILRMLAFSPAGAGEKKKPRRAVTQTAPNITAPSPSLKTVKSVEIPPQSSEFDLTHSSPATPSSLPETSPAYPETPVTCPEPQATLEAACPETHASWENILNHLPLNGMTLILAENCFLKSQEERQITLGIHSNHQAFATERQRTLLEEALRNHFNTPLKLTIQITSETTLTPALIKDQEAKNRYQKAQQHLQKDEKFQELLTQFDAKIINEILVTSPLVQSQKIA